MAQNHPRMSFFREMQEGRLELEGVYPAHSTIIYSSTPVSGLTIPHVLATPLFFYSLVGTLLPCAQYKRPGLPSEPLNRTRAAAAG
jgi:hypothetical protein